MDRKKSLKKPWLITSVVYLDVILFRIHKRDTTTEKELDAVLKMTVKHLLTQRFKENTK